MINFLFEICINYLENYLNATVCENEQLTIQCPANKLISIEFVMFGRVSHARCQTEFVSYNIDKCVTPVDTALYTMQYYCNQKRLNSQNYYFN